MGLPNHFYAEHTLHDWLQTQLAKPWNFTSGKPLLAEGELLKYHVDWEAGQFQPFGASNHGERLVRISILVGALGGGRPDWTTAGTELAALRSVLFRLNQGHRIPMKQWPAGTTIPGHISWTNASPARRLRDAVGYVQDLVITY